MVGGTGAAEADARRPVAVCLAAAVANRVSSVVPIFFGRMAGLHNTDRVDVTQGVELVWRELGGLPRADALRHELAKSMPRFRRNAARAGIRGGAVVVPALDAISALIDESVDGLERLRRSMAAAVAVAVECDLSAVSLPAGQPSWTVYELRGQAELLETLPISADGVSAELVSELRMRSGMESTNYRNAMRSILDSANTA